MLKIEQYDDVELVDGREGCVIEVFDSEHFLIEVGSSLKDWDTIGATINDIVRIISQPKPPG